MKNNLPRFSSFEIVLIIFEFASFHGIVVWNLLNNSIRLLHIRQMDCSAWTTFRIQRNVAMDALLAQSITRIAIFAPPISRKPRGPHQAISNIILLLNLPPIWQNLSTNSSHYSHKNSLIINSYCYLSLIKYLSIFVEKTLFILFNFFL